MDLLNNESSLNSILRVEGEKILLQNLIVPSKKIKRPIERRVSDYSVN